MSDPVSPMDVEDVLSSIRRLVSEESKAMSSLNDSTGAERAAPSPKSPPQGQAANPEPPRQTAAEPSSEADMDLRPPSTVGVPPSNDIVQDAEPIIAPAAANTAPAGGDQKLVLTAALRVADEEPVESLIDDAPVVPAGQIQLDASRPRTPRPASAAAGAPMAAVAAMPAEHALEPAIEPQLAPAPEPEEDQRPLIERGPPVAVEPQPEPAAVAPAAPAAQPEPEPEAEIAELANIDVVAADEPSTTNFMEDDDSVLDEESLRDMVSEMVRQELTGELGDRITRNVRKLVRREIHQALASKDFE